MNEDSKISYLLSLVIQIEKILTWNFVQTTHLMNNLPPAIAVGDLVLLHLQLLVGKWVAEVCEHPKHSFQTCAPQNASFMFQRTVMYELHTKFINIFCHRSRPLFYFKFENLNYFFFKTLEVIYLTFMLQHSHKTRRSFWCWNHSFVFERLNLIFIPPPYRDTTANLHRFDIRIWISFFHEVNNWLIQAGKKLQI